MLPMRLRNWVREDVARARHRSRLLTLLGTLLPALVAWGEFVSEKLPQLTDPVVASVASYAAPEPVARDLVHAEPPILHGMGEESGGPPSNGQALWLHVDTASPGEFLPKRRFILC